MDRAELTAPGPEVARRPVRVLVVDDSAFTRRSLRTLLITSNAVEVVGTAGDGEEALRRLDEDAPDVITLDLEMPRLDGYAFLRILMRRRPLPVIVVSAHSDRQTVLRALELGALDFVAKPDAEQPQSLSSIRGELLEKVLAAATSRVELLGSRAAISREQPALGAALRPLRLETGAEEAGARAAQPAQRLVVVGCSTGGPGSLRTLLAALNPGFGFGIVVAQHMPPRFTRAFAERLAREFPFPVTEAEPGGVVHAGAVYIAPGGLHTELGRGEEGFVLTQSIAHPGDRYTPSVDRLFSSAADAAGRRAIAVVLTGMGSDGAMGAQYVRVRGGFVLAEDESTAVVFGMPRAVIATGAADAVLPLDAIIPRVLGRFARRAPTGEALP